VELLKATIATIACRRRACVTGWKAIPETLVSGPGPPSTDQALAKSESQSGCQRVAAENRSSGCAF